MSEPRTRAHRTDEILPGIFRWSVSDERIGGYNSSAFAVVDDDGAVVLIDPLPIEPRLLRKLGRIEAIVLTAGNHQRSAWRFRKLFGVPVWTPVDAYKLLERPDATFSGGDLLPGQLVAFHTPGPVDSMHSIWREAHRSTLFLSDLLTHDANAVPRFVDSGYQDEPERTRASVRFLQEHVPVEALCFAHGEPILTHGSEALRRALGEDAKQRAEAQP